MPLASRRGGTNSLTYDAAARVYRLAHRGTVTLTFEIDLRHPDNVRGRLSIREVTSGRYPMAGAGLYYRQADGTVVEPRLYSLVGAVDEVTSAPLPEGDGVQITVNETLEGQPHQKRYTVRLVGRALEVRAESLDAGGVPAGMGGYAGFTAGDIEGAQEGVNIRLPYMDAVPVTMLDHQWFVSSLLDYPRSHANALAARGPTIDPGAFANEVGAYYLPDAEGGLRPVDETVWVTLSPEIADVFAIADQPPSPHRFGLAQWVHVTLDGGPARASGAALAAWIERLHSWGVTDVQWHLPAWKDPAARPPSQWPPDATLGGAAGFSGLAVLANGRLAPGVDLTLTQAGCPGDPNPLYRPEDRVTGADGMPMQVSAASCPDGSDAGRFVLAPDAALRLAGDATNELRATGVKGVDLDVIPAWNPGYPWPGFAESPLDRAAAPVHAATIGEAVLAYKRLLSALQTTIGPVFGAGAFGPWEVGYDSFYAGYLDGVARSLSTGSIDQAAGEPYLVVPDYELAVVRPRMIGYGMGSYGRFFADYPADGVQPLAEDERDAWDATVLAYGHAGAWATTGTGGAADYLDASEQVKTYYRARALQSKVLNAALRSVGYVDAGGAERDLGWALTHDMDLAGPRLHITYDGFELWINHSAAVWSVSLAGTVHLLPAHGWLARGGDVLAYSALVEGKRADFIETRDWTLLDGRGRLTNFGNAAARDLAIVFADGRRLEERPDGSLVWMPAARQADRSSAGQRADRRPRAH